MVSKGARYCYSGVKQININTVLAKKTGGGGGGRVEGKADISSAAKKSNVYIQGMQLHYPVICIKKIEKESKRIMIAKFITYPQFTTH